MDVSATAGDNADKISRWASDALPAFSNMLAQSSKFEAKGILNSEMLAFCGVLYGLGIRHVIESGRARGQSTEIIARYIENKGIAFDSIEYDPDSEDVEVAEKRLAPFRDFVNLHYGDAFELLPKQLDDRPAIVLIDGPKGFDALDIAVGISNRPSVKAICIHDAHKGDAALRSTIEAIYPQAWFTDDVDFVEAHRDLDEDAWRAYQGFPLTTGYKPYRRGSQKMPSYGPTLCVILDPTLNKEAQRHGRRVIAAKRPQMPAVRKMLKLLARPIPNSLKNSVAYLGFKRAVSDGIDRVSRWKT